MTALAVRRLLSARPPGGGGRWNRANHRGATVSLLSGPSLAVGSAVSARLPPAAALIAGLGAAAVGRYDDAAGGSGPKGFGGHIGALRRGEVTTGAAKIVGIGAVGLLTAAALGSRRPGDVVRDAAVIAGTANLVNLLDLRPGRALKVGGLLSLALGQPGPAAACLALLPADLGERQMLGDCGANGLGALLGAALVARFPGRAARTAAVAALAALTAASEVVSYSAVIDGSPPLRWFDRLGRLP